MPTYRGIDVCYMLLKHITYFYEYCRRKLGTFDNTPNLPLKIPQTSINKGLKTSERLSEPPTNLQLITHYVRG